MLQHVHLLVSHNDFNCWKIISSHVSWCVSKYIRIVSWLLRKFHSFKGSFNVKESYMCSCRHADFYDAAWNANVQDLNLHSISNKYFDKSNVWLKGSVRKSKNKWDDTRALNSNKDNWENVIYCNIFTIPMCGGLISTPAAARAVWRTPVHFLD